MLAPTMHLVDALARVHLITLCSLLNGDGTLPLTTSVIVPFVKNTAKMTVLKGESALDARRHVASKLNHASLAALRRPLNPEKPDFAVMQTLYDAGIFKDPLSGMPIFDPSACAPKLRTALWRAYCGVATTVNTRALGNTDEALEELITRLREHANTSRSVEHQAKRARTASPLSQDGAMESDEEEADAGEILPYDELPGVKG